MEYGVDGIPQQKPAHEVVVADIAFNELGAIRHGPAEARGKIVEDEHVLTGVEQLERHVTANEAGPAGNQNAHDLRSPQSICNSLLAIAKRLKDF